MSALRAHDNIACRKMFCSNIYDSQERIVIAIFFFFLLFFRIPALVVEKNSGLVLTSNRKKKEIERYNEFVSKRVFSQT